MSSFPPALTRVIPHVSTLAICLFSLGIADAQTVDVPSLLTGGNAPSPGGFMLAAPPPAAAPAAEPKPAYEAAPGPWGKLVGDYIYLEAPAALVETFALPSTQPRWTFPASFQEQLPAFLASAGLAPDQIASLMAPASIVKEGDFVHVMPPVPFIEQLPPEKKVVIYAELAKLPVNEYYADPVLISGVSVQEWFRTSKLRPEIIEKINQLSYKRGETTAFSDVSVLLNYAQSDSEARAIFKACTRTRSLMVRLKLDENSNIPELLAYWSLGAGVRRKDIEPILHSIIDSGTLHDLGLSHILPALPRKLLYTYPGLDMAKNGLLPDCHWTSLNFNNFDAHQYLLDSRLATSQVLENFIPVEPPYQFGDILFFLDNKTGDAFHSCVHLADSLVYTKNGRNLLSPWVLMLLDDLKRIYLYKGTGRVQGFRRKDVDAARKAAAAK